MGPEPGPFRERHFFRVFLLAAPFVAVLWGARPLTAQGPAGSDYAPLEATLLKELSESLDEASGVAVSRLNPGVFWIHNDSGSGPVVYGVRLQDEVPLALHLPGAPSRDWEDLELAPCPGEPRPCLYVGDIGDNLARRDFVSILVVPEPDLSLGRPDPLTGTWRTVRAAYPGGPRDAEALLVAPDGDVYVIAKGGGDGHDVFVLTAEEVASPTAPVSVFSPAGRLPIEPAWWRGRVVTGATASGEEWVVRTYTEVFYFRQTGAAWTRSRLPCFVGHLGLGGEGVAVGPDGLLYLTREAVGSSRAALDRARCGP